MTADSHTPNSGPRNGPDGPESAWNPRAGASRRPSVSQAPQTGAERLGVVRGCTDAARPYRILVTGSRAWTDRDTIWRALGDTVRDIPINREITLVSGACPTGADALAEDWARKYGLTIERHRAETFGPWPRCGPIRNRHMVNLGADIALAFIGPCTSPRCRRPEPHPSHGASGCADLAEQAGIPTRRWTDA